MAFENQIPQFPNFARKGMPAALPHDTCPISELFPAQPHSKPQGWGLTFMLTLEPTLQGRGPSTACWSGMANCYWWADRHNGVGGFIATQIVPFAGEEITIYECTESHVELTPSLRSYSAEACK